MWEHPLQQTRIARNHTAMHSPRVSALLAAALLLIPLQRAPADTRYVWSDAADDEQVTREPPPQGIVYSRISIPDAISWRRRPEMPKAFTPKTPPSTQELFNQAASSIYWVESIEGDKLNSERITHYGSAVAISDELALTNCHVTRGSGAELTRFIRRRTVRRAGESYRYHLAVHARRAGYQLRDPRRRILEVTDSRAHRLHRTRQRR